MPICRNLGNRQGREAPKSDGKEQPLFAPLPNTLVAGLRSIIIHCRRTGTCSYVRYCRLGFQPSGFEFRLGSGPSARSFRPSGWWYLG